MFNKKKLLRGIMAAIIGGNLFLPSTTSAEIKTYTGTGEYIMSDFETPEVAKQRAKVYAERNAQEQAGVYVNSYSKMENFHYQRNFKNFERQLSACTNGRIRRHYVPRHCSSQYRHC